MSLDNEMHQKTCEECRYCIENHKVRNSGFGYCKEYGCYVSKTTVNCEEFKKKEK